MLAASDDIAVQGALIASLGEEDLEDAMAMASIAGQLLAVANVVADLDMPILAAFLADKSDEFARPRRF
ncbi:MAG: hypothetical protein M5U34_24055 [Chloroflexi bacterium]|nr:hypothetical protein [Chloroflexota bacterium]